MDRRALLMGGVAVVAAAGGYYFLSASKSDLSGLNGAATQSDLAEVDTSIIEEMSLGDANAPVTVIEYASFTCPHCRSFHLDQFDQLKANYIDTGKIHFIYREVYFDRFGLWAGMMARCGGAEKYFGIADMIYQNQTTWTKGENEGEIVQKLINMGKVAGLTEDALKACLNDGEKAQAMVALFQKNAEVDDIDSTPSFVIDGKKYGNMNYAVFSAILDEKLAG